MNAETIGPESRIPVILEYRWGNPFQFKQTVDAQMRYDQKSRGSSGHGPQRDPRDAYVLVATVAGIVVCCLVGTIIGAVLAGFGGIFLGLIAGMFVGGIGGSYVGELIKRRHYKKLDRKTKPEKTGPDSQGPFIK